MKAGRIKIVVWQQRQEEWMPAWRTVGAGERGSVTSSEQVLQQGLGSRDRGQRQGRQQAEGSWEGEQQVGFNKGASKVCG